jgi:hypothetical protein
MKGKQKSRLFPRMMDRMLVFLLLLPAAGLCSAAATSGEYATLKGLILDVAGKPVEGAEVFIYSSAEVRRTADFISSPSDAEGRYTISLPAGTYWCVARWRKDGSRWGPLMPGDRHSGDPLEIEVTQGASRADFTVADLKEAAGLIKKKTREDYIKITGRILDRDGKPAQEVYAIASPTRSVSEIPAYLSPWTDDAGRYTLYLPRGKYYLGFSHSFPAGSRSALTREVLLQEDKDNVDIMVPEE